MVTWGAPFTVSPFVAWETGIAAEIAITFQDTGGAKTGREAVRTGARRAVAGQACHLPVVPRGTHVAVVTSGVVAAVQTFPSFRVTGVTVVVAAAGHTGSKQRAGSPAITFWKLPSVVTRCAVLT